MKRDLVDKLYKIAYKRYREANLIEMDMMLQRNMSKKQT